MSDKNFGLQEVYDQIQNLKDLKTKLSLRTYTNENFNKNIGIKVGKGELDAIGQKSSDDDSIDNEEVEMDKTESLKSEFKRKTRGRPQNPIVEELKKLKRQKITETPIQNKTLKVERKVS